jgi:hypothetical protein
MDNKTEITVNRNDVKSILLIILIPLILTFIIEHFGDFSYQSFGGQIETITISGGSFTTPFGSTVNIQGGQKAYQWHSGDGMYKINGHYTDKLPYYLEGLGKDIIYPIVLIVIGLVFFLVKNKYSFTIT